MSLQVQTWLGLDCHLGPGLMVKVESTTAKWRNAESAVHANGVAMGRMGRYMYLVWSCA